MSGIRAKSRSVAIRCAFVLDAILCYLIALVVVAPAVIAIEALSRLHRFFSEEVVRR